MLYSLDKVGFEYKGFAYFKGFICITFGLLIEPNKKWKAISFYYSLLIKETHF
jgi:hypothetical protein